MVALGENTKLVNFRPRPLPGAETPLFSRWASLFPVGQVTLGCLEKADNNGGGYPTRYHPAGVHRAPPLEYFATPPIDAGRSVERSYKPTKAAN